LPRSLGRRLESFEGPSAVVLFAYLPVFATSVVVWAVFARKFDRLMPDLHVFERAAGDVLAGRSPYVPPHVDLLDDLDKFVYPPPVALPFAPLSAMPGIADEIVFLTLASAAVFLTLRILGVRDWRCYGLAFLMPSTLAVLVVGALGSLLALGLALGWRYRDRLLVAAPVLALVVVSKLFLWPVLVWLLVTRRVRISLAAAALAGAAAAAAWAAIGFAGLREYPQLLSALTNTVAQTAYSAHALGLAAGLSPGQARVLDGCLAFVAAAGVIHLSRLPDGDRRAFFGAIGFSLLASPIIWNHYFVLLLVPLGLARPRLSPLWLAPLALYAWPDWDSNGRAWQIAAGLAIVLSVTGFALRRPRGAEHEPEHTPRARPAAISLASSGGAR